MKFTCPFDELNADLDPFVLKVLKENSFNNCTQVQSESIPRLYRKRSIAVKAETGSGKTLAFVVPAIDTLIRYTRENPSILPTSVLTVIVLPTRELAAQVHEVMSLFTNHADIPFKFGCHLLTGGSDVSTDVMSVLNSSHIIIGTPGRMVDVLKQTSSNLTFSHTQYLILDEADKLLDLGFLVPLQYIASLIPRSRCTAVFSATMGQKMDEYKKIGLIDPTSVVIAPTSAESIPATLQNEFILVDLDRKLLLLQNYIEKMGPAGKLLVFVSTGKMCEYLLLCLNKLNTDKNIMALYGALPQNKRTKILQKYRTDESAVLIATDVAARGLDIDGVTFVIQFDMPKEPESFIHRIGRTARIGKEGRALAMIDPAEEEVFMNYLLINYGVSPKAVKDKEFSACGESFTPQNPIPAFNDKKSLIKLKKTKRKNEDQLKKLNGKADKLSAVSEKAAAISKKQNFAKYKKLQGIINDQQKTIDEMESKEKYARENRLVIANHTLIKQLRDLSLADRAILDLAQAAFVAFVRSYLELVLASIIKIQKLDLGLFATGIGLIAIPTMKELNDQPIFTFVRQDNIDISQIKYLNESKEEKRQENAIHRADVLKQREKEKQQQMKKIVSDKKNLVKNMTIEAVDSIQELNDDYKQEKKMRKVSKKKTSKTDYSDLDL